MQSEHSAQTCCFVLSLVMRKVISCMGEDHQGRKEISRWGKTTKERNRERSEDNQERNRHESGHLKNETEILGMMQK